MSNVTNPMRLKKAKLLQSAVASATLEGGTEGSANMVPSTNSVSFAASQSQAEEMGTALDALSAMFCGYVGSDRGLLDSGFEDLVGIVEEWRDAVPKA